MQGIIQPKMGNSKRERNVEINTRIKVEELCIIQSPNKGNVFKN